MASSCVMHGKSLLSPRLAQSKAQAAKDFDHGLHGCHGCFISVTSVQSVVNNVLGFDSAELR